MKRKWLGLALAAAMACAGAATQSAADVLAEDSAANYTAGHYLSNGADGGFGFEPWVIWGAEPKLADSTRMDDTMLFSQCGDINSENGASFRFARRSGDDRTWCNSYRGFSTALKEGDVLSFRFTCAWCKGGRGLDLFANGGHADSDKVANLIHLSGDNDFSVNGTTISTVYAPHAVTEVKITQEADGITLWLKRTSTDQDVEDLEYTTKVETDKKLTGIGLYAGGWEWSGEDIQNTANYAFYVNDLKIEGEPPADELSLTPADDDAWKVLSAEEELEFTVSRTGTDGELEVALASSNPEFAAVPASVTIADGETSAKFTVAVALQGPGNDASISASATGVTGADYGLHGPQYRISAVENVEAGVTTNFWVDWDNNGVRDDSKLTLAIEPEGADFEADAPETWTWNDKTDEGGNLVGAYVAAHFTANESARMVLKFDGVEMWGADVTVLTASIAIEGPGTIRVGKSAQYVVKTVVPEQDSIQLTGDPADLVSIDPDPADGWQDVPAGESETTFTVTSTGDTGEVTLTAWNGGELSVTKTVTIEAAPSYDGYVAYDDGSLYGANFDYAAVGEGTEKFLAWTEVSNNNDPESEFYAGATLVSSAADASVLTDGKALALYSNGGTEENKAEIKIRRPFVNALSAGQAFSVQVSPNYRDGSKGVVLQGEWEGNWYDRVEFYYGSDNYSYKINGGDPVSLGWDYGTKLIEMSLYCEADGSGYTLAFSREGEEDVVVEDLTFEGTVDGALFYSWNGGNGDENNFVFNRMAIEQVEEPVVERAIGWAAGVWNPDAAGEYEFAISATTEDIGEVALSVSPADGALSLSTDTVDLTGVTEASFAVILSEEAKEGDSFVITATPADTSVDPIEYNVTVSGTYVTLSSDDGWEFPVSAGEIWLALTASVSKYGTFAITSSDEGVLVVPEDSAAIQVQSSDASWFNVQIVGAGQATIYATAEGSETHDAEYGFTITQDEPGGDVVPVKAISIKDGEMTLTLDGKGRQVFGATELKDGGWYWQALDIVIIGDGTSVTLPMDAPKMMFKVE